MAEVPVSVITGDSLFSRGKVCDANIVIIANVIMLLCEKLDYQTCFNKKCVQHTFINFLDSGEQFLDESYTGERLLFAGRNVSTTRKTNLESTVVVATDTSIHHRSEGRPCRLQRICLWINIRWIRDFAKTWHNTGFHCVFAYHLYSTRGSHPSILFARKLKKFSAKPLQIFFLFEILGNLD